MNNILNIVLVVTAILLIAAILLQQRGTGLSSAFGGDGTVYRTKRGLERGIFFATIVLAVLFFGTAIARIILSA